MDHDAVAVWAPLRSGLRGVALRATPTGVTARPVADPLHWMAPDTRVIQVGATAPPGHGRPWDHGINVLALAPGLVVAYEDNVEANARLQAAGIDVITTPGAVLAAGRGGPHCLTCALIRD